MEKVKTRVIVNPISGSGKLQLSERTIYQHLNAHQFSIDLKHTQGPGEAYDLAKDAVDKNYQAVIVVGGDGTLNECAAAIMDTPLIMGIIPVGSGNGLGRHLGIPLHWQEAFQLLNYAPTMNMDVGTANGKPFLNVAGLGYDAYVAHDFALQKTRGFKTYVHSVLRTFRRYRAHSYKIQLRNSQFKIKALMITVANGSQFGNNAYIAPQASINDGLIDVTVIHKVKNFSALQLVIQIFNKKISHSRYVRQFQTPRLRIKQKSKIAHLDGEPFILGKKVEFAVRPKALQIWVPQDFISLHPAKTPGNT